MNDIEIKFNCVAWEIGGGSPLDNPMVYGITVETRGKPIQLGSMRMHDLYDHVVRILRKGPPAATTGDA